MHNVREKKTIIYVKKRKKINELTCQNLNDLGERDVIVLAILLQV